MECPNCGCDLDPKKIVATRHPDYVHSSPNLGHAVDCMLKAFLVVMRDREMHEAFDEIRLEPIDINAFWDRIGPAIDATERELGLTKIEPTLKITKAGK